MDAILEEQNSFSENATMNEEEATFCIIYGAPGSGKSHLIKYNIREDCKNGRISDIHVFTGNDQNDEYNYVPKSRIHGDPSKWVPIVTELVRERRKIKTADMELEDWVFDDWTGKLDWRKGIWKELVSDFRQLKLRIYAICHYAKSMMPITREAAIYAAIFHQQGKPAIDATYESHGINNFSSSKEWSHYVNAVCIHKPLYSFIWYTKNPKPGEKMYQPMACPEVIPSFKVNLPEKREREEEDEEEEEEEARKKRKRRKREEEEE